MSNTPGPWGLRGSQIRADGGKGQHVATYQICRDDGLLLASAPRLLEMLVAACDTMDCCERGSVTSSTADRIRDELGALLGKTFEAKP